MPWVLRLMISTMLTVIIVTSSFSHVFDDFDFIRGEGVEAENLRVYFRFQGRHRGRVAGAFGREDAQSAQRRWLRRARGGNGKLCRHHVHARGVTEFIA